MAKRPYGTGSLYVHRTGDGREFWYGRFRIGDGRANRRIGPKRKPGAREGLTRREAERDLQRLIETENRTRPRERLTLREAGERYIQHLTAAGRKRSTLMDYESYLRVQLVPFFGDKPLERIRVDDVEAFVAAKQREGKASKSIRNWVGLLHGVLEHAQKKRWLRENPCRLVDLPSASDGEPEIRFLVEVELDAVLRAVPADELGGVERVLYLTAAMSGLRQGELLALRWRDVDWSAGKIRVRRNLVRGHYGSPKSRRSSRAVPLATRVAIELERHHQRSAFQGDDELVFAHPKTGTALDRSKVRKRFVRAVRRAGVRASVRFHDLRHTFGTRVAAGGVPLRTLQEWMGHRDIKTTQIYADYQPSGSEREMVDHSFDRRSNPRSNVSESGGHSEEEKPHNQAESDPT